MFFKNRFDITYSVSFVLNPDQEQAVYHPGGPVIVLAGAGSGKTRVITHRLAELIKRGNHPNSLFSVTFTNKSAQEMRERTEKLLEKEGVSFVHQKPLWIGTFHAMFAKLLRLYANQIGLSSSFVIFDESDQKTVCKQIIKELQISEKIQPTAFLSAIERAKNQGISPSEYKGYDYFTDLVAKVYPLYEKKLSDCSALDFNDLLLRPLQLFEQQHPISKEIEHRFSYVLVDEFQDVNTIQYRLICHLAKNHRQIMVVGDDDQAIYSWRGADVRNILQFEKDWPEATVIKLEQNYRSTPIILEAANAIISRNLQRRAKKLFTEKKEGELISCILALSDRQEATLIAEQIARLHKEKEIDFSSIAIFYRTNAQSRVFEEALRNLQLPYMIIGGMRFYDRSEVRDILAYLRLALNPEDEIAFRRVINTPSRGIGEVTLNKLVQLSLTKNLSLWKTLSLLQKENLDFSENTRQKLLNFYQLIESFYALSTQVDILYLLDVVFDKTGYLEQLALDPSYEAISRRENLMEFAQSIKEASQDYFSDHQISLQLKDYLEKIALISSDETSTKGISLMTIHAAKGLEFPIVFITGLEEGLFPSLRNESSSSLSEKELSKVDPIDEERRLAYVALTRAKEKLYLSYAMERRLYGGEPRINLPSRFLREIPNHLIEAQNIEENSVHIPLKNTNKYKLQFSRSSREFENKSAQDINPFEQRINREYPIQKFDSSKKSFHQVIYEDSSTSRSNFRLGQEVFHERFGRGEIRGFSGVGEQLKLIILFEMFGPKTILARYISTTLES